LIDNKPVIVAFLWFELANYFNNFSFITSYINIPAYYVVIKAFLSIKAIFASFLRMGNNLGNIKLLVLNQLKQSPWIAKNYWSFILANLPIESALVILIDYFLNLSKIGVQYFC